NDITIVIATHSPFLIDLDYLDELRVIVNKENISSIENNFAVVNEAGEKFSWGEEATQVLDQGA
ncbi:MAG: hypothetical protein IIT43_04085, partial [Clostridia bacterium]|nr:hypothetical protein [Clostridia bacterium]